MRNSTDIDADDPYAKVPPFGHALLDSNSDCSAIAELSHSA